MAHRYAFQLGRETALAAAEIAAVFSFENIRPESAEERAGWLIAETDAPLPVDRIMERLGGTVKIAEEISISGDLSHAIADYLERQSDGGKIVFSLSGENADGLAKSVKSILKKRGLTARFVEPKNTATILYNRLIAGGGDIAIIAGRAYATRTAQDIEFWSARDFGRPRRNARRGMLPPKLARIMVNLAAAPKDAAILDPFCGSGTALMEALLLGYKNITGSDISPRAIEDSKENLCWLYHSQEARVKRQESRGKRVEVKLYVSDVLSISKHIQDKSIDAIITELHLGKPKTGKESEAELRQEADELTVFYNETLKALEPLLKERGVIVMAVSSFRRGKTAISIPLETLTKNTGLEPAPINGFPLPLRYARPDQFVGRDIWRFKKS